MNYSSQEWTSQGQQPGHPQAPWQYGPANTSSSYPPPVSVTTIDVRNKRLRKYDRVKAGEQTVTIRSADEGMSGNALAYVHVPQDAPKGGRRARPPFTVSGRDRELLCSVRPAGGGVYDVYGGDGAPIGRITRRSGRFLPWPRRVRWSMESAFGGEPLAGKVGTVKGWIAMVLLSPFACAIWAVMAAQASLLLLIGEKREAKREAAWELEPPCRTRWSTPGGGEQSVAVDYRDGGLYRLSSPRLDHRLVYAQAVLHVWDRP